MITANCNRDKLKSKNMTLDVFYSEHPVSKFSKTDRAKYFIILLSLVEKLVFDKFYNDKKHDRINGNFKKLCDTYISVINSRLRKLGEALEIEETSDIKRTIYSKYIYIL